MSEPLPEYDVPIKRGRGRPKGSGRYPHKITIYFSGEQDAFLKILAGDLGGTYVDAIRFCVDACEDYYKRHLFSEVLRQSR